jgi:23S rRNA pseudouridine2605 synthase
VNRLIRVAYGPFELGELDDGAVEEVETAELRKALGPELAAQANADFESPLEDEAPPPRPSGAGRRPEPGTHSPSRHFDRKTGVMDSGPRANARGRKDKRKKPRHRRDRSGGPRPSRPWPES